LAGNGRIPHALVLDAGPLIALTHPPDPDHEIALAGFTALAGRGTRLIAPLPVVCEVYKWLLYHIRPSVARNALAYMRGALEIEFSNLEHLDEATATVVQLGPGWMGTLEDALVATLALRLRVPAWTLNDRHLSAFPRLELWAPGVP
jgi:predicted nucleic acid-binding protein